MPPRFAYWTILIDNKPTAFRAHERDELLPTFQQLKRTNPNIEMKWFARSKLWDSPEQARFAARMPATREKRGADWRPGGQHKDPRARFARKKRDDRSRGARPDGGRPDVRRPDRPRQDRTRGDGGKGSQRRS
jgi:hypothetical protein